MRIFIITTYPIKLPYDDAAKNLAIGLVKSLKSHKFTLIGSGKNFLKSPNVKWLTLPFPRKNVQDMPLLQRIFILLNITFFQMRSTDIFHFIVTPEQHSSSLFRIIFRLFNKKSVQTITSIHTLEIKRKHKNLSKLFFADKVICLSNYSENRLKKKGIRNIKRIYPGVSLTRFNPEAPKMKNIKQGAKHVIIYPGNYKLIDSCYSFNKFCKIISLTLKESTNVRFIMACRIRSTLDRKLEKKFKKIAASWNILNNITFLNSVENMPSLLNSSDIGIYPSEKRMTSVLEIPLVLLELMAMKKPIIFGNIPPLDEIMKSKIGIMLSSHSPETYAKEIINLIKKPGLMKEMGINGRKTVTKHFNLDTSLKAYKEQYGEIIRK